MPNSRYTGKEVKVTFGTMTTNWISIAFNDSTNKAMAKSADSRFAQRVTIDEDCSITLSGWNTDDTLGYTLAEVQALKGKSPTALTFTDTAGTPASLLRSDFFTDYPLSKWRVDDVRMTQTDQPSSWEITLTPNNLDAPKA